MRVIFRGESLSGCIEQLDELLTGGDTGKMETPKEGYIYSVVVQFGNKELKTVSKKNNLEAYGSVSYTNNITYNIKQVEDTFFEIHEIEEECETFTKEGLIQEILTKGIKVGVINEAIEELLKSKEKEVLIARGISKVDDEQDRIVPSFKNKSRNVEEDSIENVDFKNLYTIAMVKSGAVIGELIRGQVGKDGIDVYGTVLKKKNKKRISLVSGVGCKVEDDKVIATVDGRPSMSGQVFNVNSVYKLRTGVNIKSGDINFIGDVDIEGGVEEGMTVSGNSVNIVGNVEGAKIKGKGEINIEGNILRGNIIARAEDEEKSKCLSVLSTYRDEVEGLVSAVKQLKEYNTYMAQKNDGEIIKALLEGKYKGLTRNAMKVITYTITGVIEEGVIADVIRQKFVGIGPLNIKFVNDLYNFIDLMNKEIERLNNEVNIEVNINISYCQDSVVDASGDIIIGGKGQYVSELKSLRNIIFTSERAVCRGGSLEAEKSIVAVEIGTPSGAVTNLKVSKGGMIIAQTVYHNTVFTVGERSHIFEDDYKNVKAYINKYGELEIEKILL